jgi:LPS sulfotransferase NodH
MTCSRASSFPGASNDSPHRFVLLSTQRSGTSWFIERMAAHPEVAGYGELLLPLQPDMDGWADWPPGAKDRPYYDTYLEEHGLGGSRLRRHLELFDYLDYVYERRRNLRAIGFKLMYDQVRLYPEILVYLRIRAVRVLHLIRTNVLDILLSREAGQRRSVWHARSPEELETVRVHVTTSELLPKLTRLRREQMVARSLLKALGSAESEFSYERALADDAILWQALQLVGVQEIKGVDLSPISVKLAPLSHRDGIANFEEVEEALVGTRFARLLRP